MNFCSGPAKVSAISFLCLDGDVTVGRVTLVIQEKPDGRPGGIIEDVWVHEDFRRRGIASELMGYAIEHARSANCYKVVLICEADTQAHAMYRKLGFRNHQQAMRIDNVLP
jgi:ribosomal protein S18 acetylase RimI-like enzyme